MRRGSRRTALLALAALAVAGCQSVPNGAIDAQAFTDETLNDPVEPIGPGSTLEVAGFEWDFTIEGQAVDGPVTVNFENTGTTVHNFRIDAAAGETKKVEAEAGEADTDVLKLFGPGEYRYYCDIPGHASNGMEGTIVVYATAEEAAEAATEAPTEDGA